jgi:SAM-dependent methyltransferase
MIVHTARRWAGRIRFRAAQVGRAFLYRLPVPWGRHYLRTLWDGKAEMIHATWGEDQHDFDVIGRLIDIHRAESLLDVGCGSGRLFRLYKERGVGRVMGVDISRKALDIARRRHPEVPTTLAAVEDLPVEDLRFDLAICNRVLQHVPSLQIRKVVARLARSARRVYVNELSATEGEPENFYMVRHDYVALFGQQGCRLIDEGQIGAQRYQVFERTSA